jgi:uncharacterized protein (TIGR03118 family)
LEERQLLSASFVQTNLVSDISGLAQVTDPNLVNPWGLTLSSGSPFWTANQGSGTSTLYNGQGQPQGGPLIVNIPINPNDPTPQPAHGSPTGDVFNTDPTGFKVTANGKTASAIFLFATTDGTISGWAPGLDRTHAIIGNDTNPGALYTGLTIGTVGSGAGQQTFLYAADFSHRTIDVFDSSFNLVTALAGNFTDSKLPSNYRPFNVQNINGKLYVEYAPFNPATGGVLAGGGNGIVDVFNTDGTPDTSVHGTGRLITGRALNDPFGVALAPASFGAFSNDLLVGNFGSGTINAFDPTTGRFLGELRTTSGQPFAAQHLWSIQFGNGKGAGSANTLFFTAGLTSHFGAGTGTPHGLFGSLQAVADLPQQAPLLPNLAGTAEQTLSTVAANGDVNPYGVAFVPQNIRGGGALHAGDILVSNFNDGANVQGTGSTIVRITPDGQQSTFFQGAPGLGLTTALGVLPQGFVLVGSAPAVTQNGQNTVGNGSLLILDSNGKQVGKISDPTLLQGPWDLTINDEGGDHAQVFVSNVLSGTVTRLDLRIPRHGVPVVSSMTQVASGFAHGTNASALVVGPTGLAFDEGTDTLYVASTGDNAIFAIKDAARTRSDQGMGTLVVQDAQHLHGPLGLVLAPNGDLIVANGDAVNGDPSQSNELVEFTRQGKFVSQFQLDPGTPGAAFGLAVQTVGNQVQFAAVNDNTNAVDVWTFRSGDEDDSDEQPDDSHKRQSTLDALFGMM